jgi:hypothetical protein
VSVRARIGIESDRQRHGITAATLDGINTSGTPLRSIRWWSYLMVREYQTALSRHQWRRALVPVEDCLGSIIRGYTHGGLKEAGA